MLLGDRRGPVARHEFVGNAAKKQLATATGVFGHESRVFGIVISLMRPAEVSARANKIAVERHMIESDQFAHSVSPFAVRPPSV